MPYPHKSSGTFPVYLSIVDEEFTGTCGYTYYPADPGRMNPPDQAYPPTEAECEFYDLKFDSGLDISNLLELGDTIDELDDQFDAWGQSQYEESL